MRICRYVWRGALLVLLAAALGYAWGLLMDWLWPYTWLKLGPEIAGGVFIGLAVSLRGQRFYFGGE